MLNCFYLRVSSEALAGGTMASAIKESVANLKKKLSQIEDPKVREGVIAALRRLRKALTDEIQSTTRADIAAAKVKTVPW
jgi:hypothetical protein